jgi:hypothetical protein
MTHISIFSSARRELLSRMACFAFATAVLITGPMLQDCRAPDSLEEAWLLERVYGPPPRWVVDIVPRGTLEQTPVEPGETLQIQDVFGIRVGLLTTKDVPHPYFLPHAPACGRSSTRPAEVLARLGSAVFLGQG